MLTGRHVSRAVDTTGIKCCHVLVLFFSNPNRPQQEIMMQKVKVHVANSTQSDSKVTGCAWGVVLSSSIHLLLISSSFETLLLILKIFIEDDEEISLNCPLYTCLKHSVK